MQIDLNKINKFVLTLRESKSRYELFKKNTEQKLYNIIPFYGEKMQNPTQGFSLSYYNMIKSLSPPVLLMEDDVALTENFSNILTDVPKNADAIYLGTSAWGTKNNGNSFKNFNIQKYNDSYYKIEYMTTTHSILYLTDNFYNDVIENFKLFLNKSPIQPLDICIANLQPSYNVYGVAKPYTFQNTTHENNPVNEYLTKYPLEKIFIEKST